MGYDLPRTFWLNFKGNRMKKFMSVVLDTLLGIGLAMLLGLLLTMDIVDGTL